jgi:hypothetical protein
MDPIQRVDQSQGTYWRRIYEYFHANKTFESTCTEVSLMNRWSGIRHDVNVFCGCLCRIEARNQSGSTVDDKVNTIFEWYDHLSHFFVLMFNLFWFEMCRSQIDVHFSRPKTRSRGSLP